MKRLNKIFNLRCLKFFHTQFLIFLVVVTSIYPEKNLGFKQAEKVQENELEVFLDQFFKERKLDNHSLVVISKDGKSFFKSFPERSNSFSELTRFDSRVFKEVFLILGILKLYESEKLNLRGDVFNYKLKYERNFKQNILIENVLTHTTGIQENIIYPEQSAIRNGEYWNLFPPTRFSEPNELIGYNKDNVWILESILKEISGKSSQDFITNSFLSKLNLENTNFENDRLLSNGKDIERILPIFLNPEEITSKSILKPETWKEILQEKIRLEDKLPGSATGFFEHYENKLWGYSKLYESNTVTEELIFFPNENFAIYVYIDTYHPSLRRELIAEFLDRFYPVDKKKIKRDKSPGYTEYLKNFEGEYAAVQISTNTISKFRMYSTSIRITQANGLLILESGKIEPYGDLEGRLEFIETEPFLFRSPDRETYISFKMNEAGDVEYLLSGSGQHGAYKKLTLRESKFFQENLFSFFVGFYSVILFLLVVEIPYVFAKKIAFVPNRIRQTIQFLLWLETILTFILFGSFYYFVDTHHLTECYDFIIDGNPYDYLIFTLPFAFILGVSFLTYYTLRATLDKILHVYRLIQVGLFLLVSLGFIYWMSFWNLIGYGF